MATGIRGATSNSTGSGSAGTLAVPLPAGCQVGDVAYFGFNIGAGATITDTTPTGWTKLASGVNSANSAQLNLYEKVLTSGDISTGSVTGTASASRNLVGVLVVTTGGTHESVSAVQSDSGTASGTIPSATPSLNDSLLIAFSAAAGDTNNTARAYTPPAGWTKQVEATWTTAASSTEKGAVIFTEQLAGGGGAATGTSTWTNSGVVRAVTAVVVLAPVATGPTNPGAFLPLL